MSEPEGLDRQEMVKRPLEKVERKSRVGRVQSSVVFVVVTCTIPDRRQAIQADSEKRARTDAMLRRRDEQRLIERRGRRVAKTCI